MKSVLGIINLEGNDNLIKEMVEHRSLASIPFAGRYRIIDFPLSNMVNSGVGNVGVLLSAKSRSILDHLRSGKDWDLARHRDGLSYLPTVHRDGQPDRGNIEGLYRNIDFVEHSTERYVLLVRSDAVYNMNFSPVLRFHQNTGADVTLVYNTTFDEQHGSCTLLDTAENGLVTDLAQKMVSYEGAKLSMGIYLMEKRTFLDIVRDTFEHGGTDFMRDGLMPRFDDFAVYGYEHKGYVARMTSTAAYYKANMDVLRPGAWEELFMGEDPIYTKSKDEVPVQYKDTAKVTNSLVANGCVIRGEVENSIIFRGVNIAEGVKVKDSIVMQQCDLEENALLEHVICDKNVRITRDKWLKGAANYPLIISKNVVI